MSSVPVSASAIASRGTFPVPFLPELHEDPFWGWFDGFGFVREIFMKFLLFAVFFSLPFAIAHAEVVEIAAKSAKMEATVKLSAEVAKGLFDRIRGAHLRAIQRGSVAIVVH